MFGSTDDEETKQERWKLENELKELRSQISKSGLAGELSDLRRELDRSERQRAQLSDHIEVCFIWIVNYTIP